MHAINLATDNQVFVILPSTVNVIADVYGLDKEELVNHANDGRVFFVTGEDRCIDYDELEEYYEVLGHSGAEFAPHFIIRKL